MEAPNYTVLDENNWLAHRKTVVTATESSTLLGLNPWSSPAKIIREKQESTFTGNAYTLIGQWLEPVVIKAANHILNTDFKLLEVPGGKPFYTHRTVRLGATPDAGNETMFLEAKTTKPFNYLKYAHNPPKYYVSQLITQLMCGEKESGYLAIMSTDLTQETDVLSLPLSIFHVMKCPKIVALMEQEVDRFWRMHEAGKQFRVDSKVKKQAHLLIPLCYRKIV